MDLPLEITEKYGLYIVEDAAKVHGAKYKKKRVCSLVHIACFDFYPSKNLGTYNDAEIIVTNDRNLQRE